MSETATNLGVVRERITRAASVSGRDPGSITLVAVSKTRPAGKIREAINHQQVHFGENYLQEALEKIDALSRYRPVWHFIGPIQSNKTRDIAAHFDWVHSVDRYKIARRLSEQRPDNLPPLNICLQVNISRERSKAGVLPDDAAELVKEIGRLPRLQLRGLMAIPAAADTQEAQRRPFASLRQLRDRLNTGTMDTLSMGMTDDLEAAIAEGATMVRVGTAIFGPRTETPQS